MRDETILGLGFFALLAVVVIVKGWIETRGGRNG